MPAAPNYYQILELSPDVDDLPTIEKQLNALQSRWAQMANQGSEGDRRRGTLYLSWVNEIRTVLTNPGKRREHRQRERVRLDELHQAALAQLEGFAKVLRTRAGGCTDAELTNIAKQLGSGWDDKKVRKELERCGVSFTVTVGAPQPVRETLDPAVAKTLRDELGFLVEHNELKRPDLYELLGPGFSPNTSCDQLRDEADRQEKELRRRGKTDAVSSSRLALLGQCRTLLGNPTGKIRYDNYRTTRVMEPFKKHLYLGIGTSKLIQPSLADEVVALAAAQGILAATARQFIEDFAHQHKFYLGERDTKAGSTPLQCGFCSHLAIASDAEACRNCGKSLLLVCPNPSCKSRVPTQNPCCQKCGYETGNAAVFFARLEEAKKLLCDGDLEQARERVEMVLSGWRDYPDAVSLLKQIQERKTKDAQAERELRVLLAQRKGAALRERLAGRSGQNFVGELLRQADGMVADAQRLVEEGRRLQAVGRPDDAIDRFEEALRVCADYANARLALSACPPDPPPSLNATLQGNVVLLQWSVSPSRGSLLYRVVRKSGSAPHRPDDGTILDTISGTRFTDSSAPVGETSYYAIYSERGGVPSNAAALSGPTFYVANVSGVRAVARDGSVELSWTPLPHAEKVEVWSKAGDPPTRRGEGKPLSVVNKASASHSGLTNGRRVGYLVIAVFRGPDGLPRYAPGVPLTALPVVLPRPVNDLIAVRIGTEVEATWTPPVAGLVEVFVAIRAPGQTVGELLAADELDHLGLRLPSLSPGRASGKVERSEVLYLTPVTVAGGTAVVGRAVCLTMVEEIAGLSVRLVNGKLLCRWDWPDDIATVRLVWRTDRFPIGPTDKAAQRCDCSRFTYDQNGGFALERPDGQSLYLVVHTAKQTTDGWHYSSGTGRGASRLVPLDACNRLSYRFAAVKSLWNLFRSSGYELRITPETAMSLPALVLVVQSGRVPLDRDDGTAVLHIEAATMCAPDDPLVLVVPSTGLPRNPCGGLFPENPEDEDWLDLRREA